MDVIARLARVDLNLLVALDALLTERNVTRAGRRLGLSQPAMSNALSRLRGLLEDPVLVRAAGVMVPTPRAEGLIEPVRRALAEIDRAIAPPDAFDPSRPRSFVIAVTDYVGFTLLPGLCAHLAECAPAVSLTVWPLPEGLRTDELASGQLDLAISFFRDLPEPLRRAQLYTEEFVCAVRKGHPGVGKRLTLKKLVALPHVLISPKGGSGGVVDHALASRGLSRRLAVRLPHFLVAPQVVAETDCVVTLAARVARAFSDRLALFPPPLPLPGFAVYMVWHERVDHDPAHAWLRQQIARVAAAL